MIAILGVMVAGCTSEKTPSITKEQESNITIYGKAQRSQYGYRKMCERSFRRGEENIFCSRENLCVEISSMVTFDKNGKPVAGRVDDINFVKEFCR